MGKKFGPIMQMAFIVDSFEDSLEFWTRKMNVGPFVMLEGVELKDVYYKDSPADIDFSGAIAYTGSMQVELIKQYCDTPSIYNEYVNNEKGPLHHLAALTDDIENDIHILESQGYTNLQGGKTQDNGEFAYQHTKDKKDPIFELAQLSKSGLDFFDMMKDAAKNWDRKSAIIEAEVIL